MSNTPRVVLALAVLATLVPASPALGFDGIESESSTIDLTHRTLRKWRLDLPNESFVRVGAEFDFKATLGRTFKTKPEGTALAIDTDGDGTFDVKVEGKEGVVTLRGKAADGSARNYGVRLVNKAGWHWAPGGAMTGKIGTTKIRLIDQNHNGSYTDFGKDAMIVGRGRYASFLSRVVNLDGKLLELDITDDGSSITAKPFTGATATLALGCDTKAKVLEAILRSRDGQFSFDAARAADGMLVPAATYSLVGGEIGLGTARLKMRTGRARDIVVAAGGTTNVSWGGPVKAEFAYARQGDQVQFSPQAVWYFGDLGEEYYDSNPLGKSPKFTVRNLRTGREIAEAFFPGNC